MSDLRDKFKALKEQRGSAVPTAAQLRMLKQQKQQQKAAGASSQPAPAKPPPTAPTHQPAASSKAQQPPSSLPDDFFQAPAPKKQAVAGTGASTPSARPVTSSAPSAGLGLGSVLGAGGATGAPPNTALPQGFFSNKEADAKARGVKLPDAKDKEAEFQELQRMLDEQVKQAEVAEAEQAEEEATDKAQREDFIQWMRMQRLEDIKNRKAAARGGSEEPPSGASERVDAEGSNGQQGDGAPEATEDVGSLAEYTAELLGMPSAPDGLGLLAAPQRKKRVIDTLRELLPGSDESEGSDEEGEDPVLDWRSKGV